MSEITDPTPAQLIAQRNEIDRQIAIANLTGLIAIQTALKAENVGTLAADLEALLPQLAPAPEMGSPFNQANNVINVMRNVTGFFDQEVARVQALVDAQAQA